MSDTLTEIVDAEIVRVFDESGQARQLRACIPALQAMIERWGGAPVGRVTTLVCATAKKGALLYGAVDWPAVEEKSEAEKITIAQTLAQAIETASPANAWAILAGAAALIGPDALAQQCADRDRITGLGNVPVAALLLESRPDGALYLLTTLSFERRAMH
jgi:hypothetical protein